MVVIARQSARLMLLLAHAHESDTAAGALLRGSKQMQLQLQPAKSAIVSRL
jgi:hypothetical protein